MTKLLITNAEKNGIRFERVRLQPLVTWLHFLNFFTIAILCLLFLKLYKTLLLLYEWLFPFKHVSECPVILVLGPKSDLIQEVIFQLSQTFSSEVTVCQDFNENFCQKLKPKKCQRTSKSQIICNHTLINSQKLVSEIRARIEKTFGFIDILVIFQNEDSREKNTTHFFLNHLNKQLLTQFWIVMAFLPGMLRRNRGYILSVALGRTSLANTGIMRTIHEELLQCNTNVKLTLVESNNTLDKEYLPSLSSDVLASLIVRSMWNSKSVVKVPSLACYLIMLPILLLRFLLRPVAKIIPFVSLRSWNEIYQNWRV